MPTLVDTYLAAHKLYHDVEPNSQYFRDSIMIMRGLEKIATIEELREILVALHPSEVENA